MANVNSALTNAKKAKKDEFYTQYEDIQREVNAYIEFDPDTFRGKTVLLPCDDPEWSNFTKFFAQNFERLGLKKLISTSYAAKAKAERYDVEIDFFHNVTRVEESSARYDASKTDAHGKIFILEKDTNGSGHIDLDDLDWRYLEGDGDFRSDEVKALRDESDIIVTNPPFSMFREFVVWVAESNKKFLIIGNQNAITYKEIFPLIKENKMWLGKGFKRNMAFFSSEYEDIASDLDHREGLIRVSGVMWFTNLDHGRRHQPVQLMTMEQNLKHNKRIKETGYPKYDNYDAIEIGWSDAIPSDYDGVMGVPITFITKHCPEQFEIIGATESEGRGFSCGLWNEESGVSQALVNGNKVYKRIFIRRKSS